MTWEDYHELRLDRPELMLPLAFGLCEEYQALVNNPKADVAAERAAYILAGGVTHWPDDKWRIAEIGVFHDHHR